MFQPHKNFSIPLKISQLPPPPTETTSNTQAKSQPPPKKITTPCEKMETPPPKKNKFVNPPWKFHNHVENLSTP